MGTVLVTGGTGTLGRALTRRIGEGHHVRVLSRGRSSADSSRSRRSSTTA